MFNHKNDQEIDSKINRFQLENGITLIVIENPTCEIISGKIFIKNCGGKWETKKNQGISNLVANLLTKGTHNLTALEIAEKVEARGANLSTDVTTDYFVISLKTITHDFEYVLKLTEEIIRSPSFPISEIELEKNLTLQEILGQKEQPFNIAFNQLKKMMYKDHPYGLSILGSEENILKFTQNDFKQYQETFFKPNNLVISLAGKLSKEEGFELINNTFGKWQKSTELLIQSPQFSLISNPEHNHIRQETQQSIIMLGYLAAEVKSQDYPILKLLNTYLGNGLSSRLFVELREKKGLAYDVSCFYPTRLDKSQFVLYMGTSAQNIEIGIKGLETEVKLICSELLSLEDLQIAKNKLLGQYALGKQTNSELAQLYGWYETLELGIEYDQKFPQLITEITVSQVQEVAQRYFTDYYLSVVGNY